MKTYRCDICGREVEHEHQLRRFGAYNPATGSYNPMDHCPLCLKRSLAIFTVLAMADYTLLDFDEDTTLGELIGELSEHDKFLFTDARKRITDRETDFKVTFTKNPEAMFWKREEEE